MVQAQGMELMVMVDDDLLGEDLDNLHPMDVYDSNMSFGPKESRAVTDTTTVVYGQQEENSELLDSASKPRSVSRSLFPTKDST